MADVVQRGAIEVELRGFVSEILGVAWETPPGQLDSIQQVQLHELIRAQWRVDMSTFRLRDLPTWNAVATWIAGAATP